MFSHAIEGILNAYYKNVVLVLPSSESKHMTLITNSISKLKYLISLISYVRPSSKAVGINKEKHMGIWQKNQRESGWRPVTWESDQAWGDVG